MRATNRIKHASSGNFSVSVIKDFREVQAYCNKRQSSPYNSTNLEKKKLKTNGQSICRSIGLSVFHISVILRVVMCTLVAFNESSKQKDVCGRKHYVGNCVCACLCLSQPTHLRVVSAMRATPCRAALDFRGIRFRVKKRQTRRLPLPGMNTYGLVRSVTRPRS